MQQAEFQSGAQAGPAGGSGAQSGARPSERQEASRGAIMLAGLLIVLAGLAAYGNSLHGQYVFDDITSIVNNMSLRHAWPPEDALTPPPDTTMSGRPVLNYTFALNYAAGGLKVTGYHAVNLLIHLLGGLALFGLVRRTLGRPVVRGQFSGAETAVALTVALLWTVHPLTTQAVSYLSQRAELLAGLFYLLTLYALARAADAKRAWMWLLVSVGACLLGMGTKEVMVTAPVMALLYDRTFIAGSFQEAWTRRKGYYCALAATWIWLGWLIAGTHGRAGTVGFDTAIGWEDYALTQLSAVAHYLALACWPAPLVFDYGEKLLTNPAEVATGVLVTGTLLAATLWALVKRPVPGFLGAGFFLILAPSSSVVPLASQTLAEYRMYLPLAAVITLVVAGTYRWAGWRIWPAWGMAALALGWVTHARNEDYRTRLALAVDTVAKAPDNPRAVVCLGDALLELGRLDDAIAQYTAALKMKPDYFIGHNGLGMALIRAGRVPEGTAELQMAIKLRPESADAHYNLGQAYFVAGKLPETIRELQTALALDATNADAYYYLGNALAAAGDPDAALSQYAAAVRLEPGYAKAEYSMGTILAHEGKLAEALGHFDAAVRMDPRYAAAWGNRGATLAQMGRLAEAVAAFQEAVRLDPQNAEQRKNLELAERQLTEATKNGTP